MKSIPWHYNMSDFRSKLEATYAAFFEQCGWSYCYEPFAVKGWGPDFCLYKLHQNGDVDPLLLVEVKPTIESLEQAQEKIEDASWYGMRANRSLGDYRLCSVMMTCPELIGTSIIGAGYLMQGDHNGICGTWTVAHRGTNQIRFQTTVIEGYREPSVSELPQDEQCRYLWEKSRRIIEEHGFEVNMPARRYGPPDDEYVSRHIHGPGTGKGVRHMAKAEMERWHG